MTRFNANPLCKRTVEAMIQFAALVDWGDQSLKSLETTLNWLVHFLDEPAVLVIRLVSRGRGTNRKLQSILEELGFRVEAGGRDDQALVVSARRRDAGGLRVAA
jgi:hypothetical protein